MRIIITGTSRGLGRELVKIFAKEVSNEIIALSRNQKLLQSLKDECQTQFNNNIHIYKVDFLSTHFQIQLDELFAQQSQPYDVLINNAGLLVSQKFCEANLMDVKQLFQVNYFGPFQLIQQLINKTHKGGVLHVLNIGSMGGYQGSAKFEGLSAYSGAKAALGNLTECLAEEYNNTNIKFNCLALGAVETEMLKEAFPNYQAVVKVEEMAQYVAHFAQNGHKFYNGKVLPVAKTTP